MVLPKQLFSKFTHKEKKGWQRTMRDAVLIRWLNWLITKWWSVMMPLGDTHTCKHMHTQEQLFRFPITIWWGQISCPSKRTGTYFFSTLTIGQLHICLLVCLWVWDTCHSSFLLFFSMCLHFLQCFLVVIYLNLQKPGNMDQPFCVQS